MLMLLGIVGGCGSASPPDSSLASPATKRSVTAFHVLTEALTGDDAVPRQFAATLENSTQTEISARDVAAARRVLPDNPAWLFTAGENEVCLAREVYPLIPSMNGVALQPALEFSCEAVSAAEAGKLVETQSLATTQAAISPARVVGIVPDGVTSVVVRLRGGQRVRVAVARNAYEATVRKPMDVEFRRKGHAGVTKLPVAVG
jgi:hypothetical protein